MTLWRGRNGGSFGESAANNGRFMGTYGLPGRDLLAFIAKHDEHETGETLVGPTRRFMAEAIGPGFVIPPWHRDAACARPEYESVDFFREPARAKKACARCPVRLDCLEEALTCECEVRLCYGVRGGMAAGERLALIRKGEHRGTVYFGFRDGLIKIGCTRGSVEYRMRFVRCDLLATEPGLFTRERELHKRFAPLLARGHEWFKPGVDLIDYIAALPDARVEAIRVEAA